ncbi:MAG: hypothetical protein JNL11_10330 [Bdellovibrionaceae bacterium]|nr:hypothetical protein [Pseudobdellovibrionaceae bacterium]
MIQALLVSTLFFSQFSWSQNVPSSPLRIICQATSVQNPKLLQMRSDAGDTSIPTLLLAMDPQNKPFKEIISHQIVYSDENLSIAFIAAVDSQNRFGVFKLEVKNTIKVSTSQFINLLPQKLRSLVNYSRDFSFSLFSFYKGNLLYPSSDSGKWRLISLSNGAVIKEWTHPVTVFNPMLRDQLVTWTSMANDGSHLYIYNLKTDTRDEVVFEDTLQVLNINKEEIVLVNFFDFDSHKRVTRVLSYNRGSTRVLYDLDSSMALFANFVSVGNNLIFTSEKTFVTNNQIQVAEAYLNVFDTSKKIITQRIKYPQILVDIMRKQTPANLRLLYAPMFNQNEILFSLNEMGGVVKYQFKTANWFYINYPVQENTCYNPSFINVTGADRRVR